jgi:hypothetical protein
MAKVYAIDNDVPEKLFDVWSTWTFDSYSRAVMSVDLYLHVADLDVGLAALKQTIYPKDFSDLLGFRTVFPYGIPMVLSLDNAWMHLSPVFENLAKAISRNGEYTKMDILLRPPKNPKLGGLIERMLGDFARRFHELFDEVTVSIKGKKTSSRNKLAYLLVDDIKRIVIAMVHEYHYTVHSAFGQRPIDRWLEGVENTIGDIRPPVLTPELDRMFMRMIPKPRFVKDNTISIFGLDYVGLTAKEMPERDFRGIKIPYNVHYSKENISRISLIHNGTWMGDLKATRFMLPDGDVLPVSLLQRSIARTLATKARQSSGDWVDFLGITSPEDIAELMERRRQEQIAKQKQASTEQVPTRDGGNQKSGGNYWDHISGAIDKFSSHRQG